MGVSISEKMIGYRVVHYKTSESKLALWFGLCHIYDIHGSSSGSPLDTPVIGNIYTNVFLVNAKVDYYMCRLGTEEISVLLGLSRTRPTYGEDTPNGLLIEL